MEMTAKKQEQKRIRVIRSRCIQGQNLWKRLQVQTQALQSKYDMGEKNAMSRIKDDLFTRPRGRQKNAAAVCCTFDDCGRAGEESQLEKRVVEIHWRVKMQIYAPQCHVIRN